MATSRSTANPSVSLESVPPLFLKRERDFKGQAVTDMDIYRAVTRCIQQAKLEGVQCVNNLWRIYLKDKQPRLQLCVKEAITINRQNIPVYDQNPYVTSGNQVSFQKKDKLTIKHLPLSISNDEIRKLLEE